MASYDVASNIYQALAHGTTLAALIEAGVIAPGAGVISILYTNVEVIADLLPDGRASHWFPFQPW